MIMWKRLLQSLYSPIHIARFRFHPIGKAISYVFFLSLIATLPIAIYFTISINKMIGSTHQLLTEELPPFEVVDGILTSDNKEPIELTRPDVTILLDSTGTLTTDDVARYTNAVAFLKEDFALVVNGHVQSYPYHVMQVDFTNKDVYEFTRTLQSLLPIVISLSFVVLYFFTCTSKFLYVTVLAFIGLIFRGTLNKRGTYRHMWSISAYSITLATVFFTIMEALHIVVPYAVALDWFVSITILFVSIKELPSVKEAG
ncbi:DUF1189 domain-containing protein [Anoxybacillus flavithermus]|uniref:Uncharacterized membrane protein n=1 Tax=Anoxybacillus flavithermus (strain DSM 21510 / WK1) TaxID=491915 RepID=B7GH92_ANOFW|nr:DUF1189 domain-containing protein [Anoxybacillus flavithermus]ACJ33253.1 Uncharacterized membrane protein [Anoxybacillus flavithermus WK1]AST06767.1 hypothetical protein AF2641_07795 [Anoxybacillus flavithermus]